MADCIITRRGGGGGSTGGLPKFTYTGNYELIDDGNKNWRIKFLTSGTLNFSRSVGNIDVFLVGGGGAGAGYCGGGGGGGYVNTISSFNVESRKDYNVEIGAGGSVGGSRGGTTRFGTLVAEGGYCAYLDSARNNFAGGDGGSGGGGGTDASSQAPGEGGSDGSDGISRNSKGKAGKGYGVTTREFGEASGTLYAGGGGGGAYHNHPVAKGGEGGGGDGAVNNGSATAGGVNTGGGGGGGSRDTAQGRSGGSGIVVIRNHR